MDYGCVISAESILTSLSLHCHHNKLPTGPSGTVITMIGSGFGANSQHVSVTMNHVPCNVSSVSETVVQCITGNNPGGAYLVTLHHQVKGRARSNITFMYELTLSAVQPNEGKEGLFKHNDCLRKIFTSN